MISEIDQMVNKANLENSDETIVNIHLLKQVHEAKMNFF